VRDSTWYQPLAFFSLFSYFWRHKKIQKAYLELFLQGKINFTKIKKKSKKKIAISKFS